MTDFCAVVKYKDFLIYFSDILLTYDLYLTVSIVFTASIFIWTTSPAQQVYRDGGIQPGRKVSMQY